MSTSASQPVPVRTLFLVMLAVGLLCRLAFVFFTPTFYAPDEQSHYHYLQHLSEKHSFPIQTGKLGDPANDWENSQPPLYYAALLPVYRASEALFHKPAATVIALRLCSVLLWLLNVWFGLILLRRLQIEDELTRVLALAVICLLPTYVCVSAAINNDNLLATLGGGWICLLARREPSWKNSLALGLVLGLALWTKQSAVVFLPALALYSLLNFRARRVAWSVALGQLALGLGLGLLIYFPWLLRNWHLYGMLTPEYLPVTRLPWPSFLYGCASAAHNLVKTFWSVAGQSNDVGYPFPLLGMAAMALWLAGHQSAMTRGRAVDALNWKVNRLLLAALVLAVFVNISLVMRIGYLFGMGQGRHLFPLLLPIALLLSAGWRGLPVKRLDLCAAGFSLAYAVGFTAFSLSRFP